MDRIWKYVSAFHKDTLGQDMIEYSLMAGLVCVGAVSVVPGLSTQVTTIFTKIGSMITASIT